MKQSLERITSVVDRYLPNWADIRASITSLVRGSLVGTMIGAIPRRVGSDIAAFVSYGETNTPRSTRKSSAPARSKAWPPRNAPTTPAPAARDSAAVRFGVPGDAVTAVLLGAFVIQGLQPEPLALYKEHIDIVQNVFAAMIVPISRCWRSAGGHPPVRQSDPLLASILVLSVMGAYAMRRDVFDVYFMLGCGVVGYFIQK